MPAMEGSSRPGFTASGCWAWVSAAAVTKSKSSARHGPAGIALADFDIVELANLTRTVFSLADVGKLKVEALARRIPQVNPFVNVKTYPVDICRLSEAEQAELVRNVDLIIAGTDSFPAQALLNVLSQRYKKPAVFIGVHEGAMGGRIIWTLPGELPCYRCIARERYDRFVAGGIAATDLPGVRGLLVDVQIIDMVALKIALGLLERGQDSSLGRFIEQTGGRNEVIVRTSPDYEYGSSLWDAVLSDLPTSPKSYAAELKREALFAMDSIWLRTAFDPDCPDCGGRQVD